MRAAFGSEEALREEFRESIVVGGGGQQELRRVNISSLEVCVL